MCTEDPFLDVKLYSLSLYEVNKWLKVHQVRPVGKSLS